MQYAMQVQTQVEESQGKMKWIGLDKNPWIRRKQKQNPKKERK